MHRFAINFRQTASERAAQISARAYNHYLRFKPYLGKIYLPLKRIRNKFYGQNQKGTNQSR